MRAIPPIPLPSAQLNQRTADALLLTGESIDRTNAERQRRYISRLKAKAAVTNGPCAACAAKDREIARLTALVKETTQALDDLVSA